ncbi:MAG TPA: glycosyltransferase family 39 protein [Terriglobales bacterium]|nr:glycosyltransferase family 39 protein [Terriglobales bacterium]
MDRSLVAVAAAIVLASIAYRDHFRIGIVPWWQWLVSLALGGALLVYGLRAQASTSPRVATRTFRHVILAAAAAGVGLAVYLSANLGAELAVAGCVGAALTLFLISRGDPPTAAALGATLDLTPPRLAPWSSPVRLLQAVAAIAVVTSLIANQLHHLAGLLLWLLGLSLAGYAARLADRPSSPPSPLPAITRSEWVVLAGIVLLAITLRFALLADFPFLINVDEGNHGLAAQQSWEHGFPDIFAFGPFSSFPRASFVASAFPFAWLGPGYLGLRLSSAVFGVASVIVTFLWVRRWWGIETALVAAGLLAINQEHLYWSRVGFNNIQTTLTAALLLLAFARAIQCARWFDYLMLGYAAGACFYTYHAAKLFPALLLVPAALLAWTVPGLARRHLPGVALAAFAFFLFVVPQVPWIYQHWEIFHRDVTNRFDVGALVDAYQSADFSAVRRYLDQHVTTSLFVFLSVPHPLALFEAYVAVPFLLGLVWMLWHWRDPRNTLVLGWLTVHLIAGSMLTYFPPNKPRLVGLLPLACTVAAVLVSHVYRTVRAWFAAEHRWVAILALMAWFTAAAYGNAHTHFVALTTLQRGDAKSHISRKLLSLPDRGMALILGAVLPVSSRRAVHDAMVQLPADALVASYSNDSDAVPLPPKRTTRALLAVTPHMAELVPLIRFYHPQAAEEIIRTNLGNAELHLFSFDHDTIQSTRSLTATFRAADGSEVTEVAAIEGDEAIFHPPQIALGGAAVWRGQVWIPQTSRYHFRVSRGAIEIGWGKWLKAEHDDARVEAAQYLATGWQPIRIAASFADAADPIELSWRREDADRWELVPRHHLFSHVAPTGIVGRYTVPPGKRVPIAFGHERMHSALSFAWQPGVDDAAPAWLLPSGGTAEWLTTAELPLVHQPLRLHANMPVKVFVDGRLVMENRDSEERVLTTTLSHIDGRVAVRVTAAGQHRPQREAMVRLLWGLPGGGWTALANYQPVYEDVAGE